MVLQFNGGKHNNLSTIFGFLRSIQKMLKSLKGFAVTHQKRSNVKGGSKEESMQLETQANLGTEAEEVLS